MTSEPTIEPSAPPSAQTGGPLTELIVTGMTCGNCAQHVTEAIQNVGGVRTATVNLDSGKASVIWASGTEPDPIRVIQAVEAAGYRAKVAAPGIGDRSKGRLAGWRITLWIGVLGTLPLMLGEWVFDLRANNLFRWLSLGIASVVQIVAGGPFYRGAWNQLGIRSANMDTLVVLGSTTAFAYSTWALFTGAGGHLYFLEAAAIITIVSLGHWFEARASARASSALQRLLHLAPDRARRLEPDGREAEVPVAELRPGDRVALRPGDRVPTDAQVLEGNSAVDESMLTGESIPADKTAGTLLYAGTLNLNGRLLAKITSTGEETALARIIVAVQRAQTSRASIQRLGDRVSSVFVPVVMAVALAAALFWGLAPEAARHLHQQLAQFLWHAHVPTGALAAPFIIAAAVLIIACPCAMGLATPVAIMAGTNAAAQRGILIRDGIALEKAGNLTAVLFDKTGTLTVGKPHVVEIWEAGEIRNIKSGMPSATVNLAASLARNSKHPFSQAVAALSGNGVEISDWKEIPGSGVQGRAVNQDALSPREATPGTRMIRPQSPVSKQPILRLGSLRWLEQS